MNLFLLKKLPQQKSNRNQHSYFLPIMCMRYMQLKPFLSCLAAPKLSSKQTSKCVGPCQFICTSLNFFIVHHFIKLIFPGGGRILKFYHHREKNDTSISLIFKLKKNHKLENLEDRHVLTSGVLSDNSHTNI